MSFFDIIILVGAIQGIFLAIILWSVPKEQILSHRWLSAFLVCFALGMIHFVIWDSRIILDYPKLTMVTMPCEMLLGLFFYFYVCSITEKNFVFRKRQLLHFIPTLLLILVLIPFYLKPDQFKTDFNLASYTELPDLWKYAFIVSAFSNAFYFLLCWLRISKYKRLLKQYYSSQVELTIQWIQWLFLASLFIFITCIIVSFLGYRDANEMSNILFSIGVYAVGYLSFKQKAAFAGIREEIQTEAAVPVVPAKNEAAFKKYEKSGLTEDKARDLVSNLDQFMLQKKPYLNPEINLQQLSDELGVSLHHLSQLLNQYKKANFYDFINSYRVEEFKRKIGDPAFRHLSILGLAFESGFNSKASFNEAFKKQTGLTPSEYRKSLTF